MNLFQVQYPSYGFLLGIPLLAALIAYLNFARSQREFLRLTGSSNSMKRRYLYRYLLREGAFVLSFFCVVFASLGITWGTVALEEDRSGLDIVFVLDISRSMLARDVSPNRLEYAKLIVLSLVATVPDARFGLVLVKGTAIRAIPITEDRQVLESFLRNVNPSFLQSKGTNLTAGLQEAVRGLPPNSSRHRVVVLVSDGESQEPIPNSLLGIYKKEGIPIFTVGIGTAEGTVVPDPTPIRSKDGKVVISKLQRSLLQKLSAETGGIYLEGGDVPVNRKLWERILQFRTERERVKIRLVPAERHELFLLSSILFLIIHLGIRILPWRYEED
ncbi:MAG: VWA domain-containing protein [Spirochaetes bacterium]|nr:VWA domain-containing protein [Spirochaetota bacterium]